MDGSENIYIILCNISKCKVEDDADLHQHVALMIYI